MNDYLELATQFHTIMLSNVPQMPPRLASEARRFTWLVDVLYDRRVKLVVSAAVPPEELYADGPLAHEFPRTVSRLHEMESQEYLALARREVDTRLTCPGLRRSLRSSPARATGCRPTRVRAGAPC
jgi:cell division protein ZapE